MQVDLLSLNVVAYGTLVFGAALQVVARRAGAPQKESVFRQLHAAMRRRFPDLPVGFTLREGLARARQVAPEVDWQSVQRELESYESYRFGDGPEPVPTNIETARLLKRLRRNWP